MDEAELFLACLYHDIGKTFDYEPLNEELTNWKGSEHKRMIHHMSRSALIWSHAVSKYPDLYEKYHDKVLHAILAHHGTRAWGSPVSPKSQVAWLLHLCDGISARMDDWERVDIKS